MNNYRLRLILASTSLSAALTVLVLKLAGFLVPAPSTGELHLLATQRNAGKQPSAWFISCQQQIAMITQTGQDQPQLQILDPEGRPVTCLDSLLLSSPDQ